MEPLSTEQEAEIEAKVRGTPETVLIDKFGIPFKGKDLRTLQPGTWLNDEVINFWFAMLAERDAQLAKPKRSLFHNTFFVAKLAENGYNYRNVRRWTREKTLMEKCGVKNIMELDKIFMPVHVDGTHWCLAVIFIQEKKIQYYDSMAGTGMATLTRLKRYLVEDTRDKLNLQLNESEWTLVPTQGNTPLQNNGCDCGVFTCMFADYISTNQPLTFSQSNIQPSAAA